MNSKKTFFFSILVIAFAITSCNSKQIAKDAFVLKIDLSNISEEIPDKSKVDYHPKYGVIKPDEFPVKKEGWSGENILRDIGIQKEEMKVLFVTKKLYTWKLLSAHLMEDKKIVYVWHDFKDEPLIISAGENTEGKVNVDIQIMAYASWIHIPGEGSGITDLWRFIDDCIWCGINITITYL